MASNSTTRGKVKRPTFNIFDSPSREGIDVGYISSDRGYVTNVGICEANEYAKSNPGTVFIVKNREKVQYLSINEVNGLEPEDLIPFANSPTAGKSPTECSGLDNVIAGNTVDLSLIHISEPTRPY